MRRGGFEERAARIIVDGILLGDRIAATRHGVSEKTVHRYRKHRQDDPAEPDFIAKMKKKHGEHSAFYQVRIKGEFYGKATNTVVGMNLVEEACKRWNENLGVVRSEPLEFGVDIARFGDDETIIAPRRGPRIDPFIETQGADDNTVAGLILQAARTLRFPDEIPKVKIDGTGWLRLEWS